MSQEKFTIADKKIKEICWKLDREIWAHVPDGGQSEPWSQSKAREESAKLIYEYFGSVEELHEQIEHLQALLRNRGAYIETIESQISGGWISCKERLPENDGKVMVWQRDMKIADGGEMCFGRFLFLGELSIPIFGISGLGQVKNVTHWMPLPSVPLSE